jgi:hypothetical protein
VEGFLKNATMDYTPKTTSRLQNPMYHRLMDLKSAPRWKQDRDGGDVKNWHSYSIYAKTNKDIEMTVWNGKHPAEQNMTKHICKAGTRVRIWMVSSLFRDVGITDNLDLETSNGYDARVDADIDLTDYEFCLNPPAQNHP